MIRYLTEAEWRELEAAIESQCQLLEENTDIIASPKRRRNALVRAYDKVRELAPTTRES